MDILISSNLERLLYHISESAETTKTLMDELKSDKKYSFKVSSDYITGEYATQEETFMGIKEIYEKSGYVMDTHTAVAYASYKKYKKETNDNTQNVIVSTASPYKFAKDVCRAIDSKYDNLNPFKALDVLSEIWKEKIPVQISGIDKREILHKTVIEKSEIKNFVRNYLK